MKRFFLVMLMATVLAAGVFAQIFDFTLVNKTGFTINAIFVSPADDDEWGDDVLELDVLPNNKSVDIEFDEDYEDLLIAFDIDKYDLKCEYEDGSVDEWYDLKLEDIVTLTLTLDKKGNGVATWK
jgi:hypothetical protein